MEPSTLSVEPAASTYQDFDSVFDDLPDPLILYSSETFPFRINNAAIETFPDPQNIEGIDRLVAEAFISGQSLGILAQGDDLFEVKSKKMKNGAVAASFRKVADSQARIYVLEEELAKRGFQSKEIHHRIKNNLQVVSSLLSLEEEYLRDPADKEFFQSSQDRIVSMALIHEQLYRTECSTSVEADSYLNALTGRLESSYGEGRVRLSCVAEKIDLEYSHAMPLGLIVNELVTNAFKHAFPEREEGRVSLTFQREGQDYLLTVTDDGKGLPQNFDPAKSGGLGMQIITSLVAQVRGKLDFARDAGSRFMIRFPVTTKG